MSRRALALPIIVVFACLLFAPAAQADKFDRLLAPHAVCSGQLDPSISVKRQRRTMLCMHRYARSNSKRETGIASDRRLVRSSRPKARDILSCQQFSHTACGRDAFFWMREAGLLSGCYGVAENIAMGSGGRGNVREVMRGWLHSAAHRRTLLAGRYREFGVSMVRGSYQGYGNVQVWVAHFSYHC